MNLRELKRETLRMFKPPRKIGVAQWADENRILVSESSAEPGPWNTDRAPYQREIMDAFTQRGVWKIVTQAGSQVGKTEFELNCIGWVIDVDPGPMLAVQATDAFGKDFSIRRVMPMIRACKALAKKVYDDKSRDSNNTIHMKTFPGGSLAVTGANSPTELASRPIRYALLDEVDRFPKSAGTEGDPIQLVVKRTDTFSNRKVMIASTPTIRGASAIEREYEAGTQEEWYVQCPHCGDYAVVRFIDIRFTKTAYRHGKQKRYRVVSVLWQCPTCKQEADEMTMKSAPGKWIAHNPDALADGIRSFKINSFCSPWKTWESICKEFLDAGKDPELLKVWYNTCLGELWEVKDQTGAPEKLFARREHYDAEVPTGVLYMTMGVDTQDNRLEFEVVGWGRDDESWGILHGVIMGRADAQGVWDELDALMAREWSMKNGKRLRISVTFIDSGGHHTQDVYRGCQKYAARHLYAIKGEGGQDKPYCRLSKVKNSAGGALFLIGVDAGKEAIVYAATSVDKTGAMYMHYPIKELAGYDEAYFKGLLSERIVFKRSNGRSYPAWEKFYNQNEALDCRNYARAAARFFHFDLDRLEERIYGENRKKVLTEAQAKRRKPKVIISKGIQV